MSARSGLCLLFLSHDGKSHACDDYGTGVAPESGFQALPDEQSNAEGHEHQPPGMISAAHMIHLRDILCEGQ